MVTDVLRDFIKAREQFTSVDVTNEVRNRGDYTTSHGDIARAVRANVQELSIDDCMYEARVIEVDTVVGKRKAYLYSPHYKPSDDYVKTSQRTINIKSATTAARDTRFNYTWQKRDSSGKFVKM